MSGLQWLAALNLAAIPISWGGAAYAVWLAWRNYQLRKLLDFLVLQAFMNQHLPIWVPWSHMTGIGFRIEAREER